MDISPIKSARGYRRVPKEIEGLMTAKRGTAEGDRLDVLVTLVEAWEARHFPLDARKDAIAFSSNFSPRPPPTRAR